MPSKKQITVQLKPAKGRAQKKKNNQEVTAIGRALRVLGGAGGSALGALYGHSSAGAAAGTGLGAALSRWLGQGDYTVRSNTLVTGLRPDGSIPAMHRNDQSIIVRHKEFIGELTGSTTFVNKFSLPINPGISTTFPWLSTVAAQYSEYRVRGMVYHYVPTSGMSVASTNPALGSVMFQTSYRANEPAPVNKVEMMNEYWATEGRPCDEICHPIECDPKENPFNVQYVRTGPVSASDNILMYDLGTTRVCTTGNTTSNAVLGDLWVTYEIELKKPRVTSLDTALARSLTTSGTSADTTFLFGATHTDQSSIPGAVVGNNNISFPGTLAGDYLVVISYTGLTAASLPTLGTSGGASLVSPVVTAIGSSSAILSAVVRFSGVSTNNAVVVGFGTLAGAPSVTARITEFYSGFT